MSKEIDTPLQINMFSGELDDNRTRRQKKQAHERQQPKQTEMFSSREIAQFGVNAHPLMSFPSNTSLLLISEDPRTAEEKERDLQRAAEEQTYQMFNGPPALDSQTQPGERSSITPDTETLALVLYKAPCLALAVMEQVSSAVMLIESVKREVMEPSPRQLSRGSI